VSIEALIATSLARPQRNLYGDLGPRCPTCSGLGAVLALQSDGSKTRYTSRCRCGGSGLDVESIERADRDLLWHQIHELERRAGMPLTSRYNYPTIKASRQYWMECIAWATADGTAVANTTTETIAMPNVTIPANYMQDGRAVRGMLRGKWSTTTGTVTHVYKLRWGGVSGTVLATTGTVTLLVSITNGYFEIPYEIQTRSNGSSGTLLVNGHSKTFAATAPTIGSATGAPAIAPFTAGGQTAPAAVTVDLTADTALAITVTHGAASASNTITGMQYTLESMN
jgi:hypothetical protein